MKRLLILILTWSLALGTISFAQASASKPSTAQNKTVTVDEEFLKELQKALADRDRLRAENAAKDDLLASKDAQIASWKGLYEAEKVISANWKESALSRKSALTIDDKIFATYDKRVATLEADLSAARRTQKWYGIVGLFGGIAIGVYGSRNR